MHPLLPRQRTRQLRDSRGIRLPGLPPRPQRWHTAAAWADSRDDHDSRRPTLRMHCHLRGIRRRERSGGDDHANPRGHIEARVKDLRSTRMTADEVIRIRNPATPDDWTHEGRSKKPYSVLASTESVRAYSHPPGITMNGAT